MDWLHFIGSGYYAKDAFAEEATKLGANRRIALRLLGAFKWGDRVWVAQGDMQKRNRSTTFRGSEVFGYFTVDAITISPPEILAEDFIGEALEVVEEEVVRGCGTYTVVNIFPTSASIAEIAADLRLADCKELAVFLHGRFVPQEPTVRLPDYGFRWGFQRLDPQFDILVQEQIEDGAKAPCLVGKFAYPAVDEPAAADGGVIIEIDDYTVKSL